MRRWASASLALVLFCCRLAKGCDAVEYRRIDELAHRLSAELMKVSLHYRAHGWLGIFADVYNGSKTRFIYDSLCAEETQRKISVLCEVGFNAGHSAMLLLESVPHARLVTFDVGGSTKPWVKRQGSRLKSLYGERFELILGDSNVEVPIWTRRQGHAPCDVILIDGSKTYEGRLADLTHLREASRVGSILFLDEVR
jgi:hypothetical protein